MARPPEPPVSTRMLDLAVLLFAFLLPTGGAWLYFVLLAEHRFMQVAYGLSKIVQFALPIAWVVLVQRRRVALHRPRTTDIAAGLALGIVMVAVGLAAYHGYFRSSSLLANAASLVAQRLEGMGLDSPVAYFAFTVFLCAGHSLLEEYYWRWFVFGQAKEFMPVWAAIGVSSLGFMAHHVIVVDRLLDAPWPFTLVLSLAVAMGGAAWAWLYARTGSLVGPWISHALVDAGLMYIGYDLVWRST